MLLADAIQLIKRLIETGETNQDYKRVVELADKYKKLITGVDIGSLLMQFIQREDAALFEQRVKLTRSITPAVAASIKRPFSKAVRNNRVRKSVETTSESRTASVYAMIKGFYGAARKQSRGLDYWLKTRFLEMQFTDPNSWVVVEWTQPGSAAQVVLPRPFEVPCEYAHNWQIINDELKWLEVRQPITFLSITTQQPDAKPTKTAGYRYTLYDEDLTVVYEQCDSKYLAFIGYQLQQNETIEKIKEVEYLVKVTFPKVGYVPAFRIGYASDEVTNGRTFVNPWHDALCYFEKSLKSVSEMDLTLALHVFPQKIQYVKKCIGEERGSRTVPCRSGRMPEGSVCKTCKGAGYQIHTTAADVINIPMPEDAKDMFNLDQMLVYKAPPIETVKFQNEYILQLEKQSHQAVFNSQIFVKSQYTNQAQGTEAPTATESDYNMESVYDTLVSFTDKWSELWLDIVTTFAIIAGESLEKIKVVHKFPADPKLKTIGMLMAERQRAVASQAPAFMIAALDDDLADILFDGDDLKINKYYVKRQYFPFPGKTADEIATLLASQFVPKYFKVLYSNFDEVFKQIEKKNPEIWADATNTTKIDTLVKAKVEEFIKELGDNNPVFSLEAFRGSNPANQEGSAAA